MTKKLYAVVDLETTGGISRRDKITEIGIVLFDGNEIVETYQSLINPGRSIPAEITRITGITNEMVADAPYFYEVAKKVVEMTEGAIFVAHNVRFDYSFLKEEFGSLGYTYSKKQLCTVRLSRSTFPGLPSYSLGNLIRHFGIQVSARHRALDDALATTEILKMIVNDEASIGNINQIVNAGIKSTKLPEGITLDLLHELPEEPGVYYFHNTYGKVIYVGKSINIRKRVMQHFGQSTLKAEKLTRMVADISTEETGSELIAMLHEAYEIKRLRPDVNKAQRTSEYPYFIYTYYDDGGYVCFDIEKVTSKSEKDKTILSYYSSRQSADQHLSHISKNLMLCQSKTNQNSRGGQCFAYDTKMCLGACIGKELSEDYNERAEMACEGLKKIFDDDFLVVVEGRTPDELGIVLIEEGHYRGYGYISKGDFEMGIEEIKEAIRYVPKNPEYNGIVRTYLSKYPYVKRLKI